jgi:biopolymer transport protein ExbD
MAGGGGNSDSGEPEFQIAPMIDVLLVLLIFFMSITSAEVLNIDKDIHLPVAPNAKKKDTKPNANFGEGALNIKWNKTKQQATFSFEGKVYDQMDQLTEILQKRKGNLQTYRVILRADKDTPAVEIQKAMGVLGSAGMDNIAFSALNKDDG